MAARIRLAAVPLLPGAEALSAAGHGSTLLPMNRAVAARMVFARGPRTDLLFDPQTAGGLLAAVPAGQAQALLAELQAAGEPAAIIGQIEPGAPCLIVE